MIPQSVLILIRSNLIYRRFVINLYCFLKGTRLRFSAVPACVAENVRKAKNRTPKILARSRLSTAKMIRAKNLQTRNLLPAPPNRQSCPGRGVPAIHRARRRNDGKWRVPAQSVGSWLRCRTTATPRVLPPSPACRRCARFLLTKVKRMSWFPRRTSPLRQQWCETFRTGST